MNIRIIGSGMIGGTAARLFVRAGHQIAISNSRGPASVVSLAKDLGSRAHAATIEGAASFGGVVLAAIPFGKYVLLPGKPLEGKVVVDAMNYYPQRDDRIEFGDLAPTKVVAPHLRVAHLVKAFNTMYYETFATQGRPDAPVEDGLALFVAGDDAKAKAMVSHLIGEIGFAPIDTGSLHDGGRRQQSGSSIYNRSMTAGRRGPFCTSWHKATARRVNPKLSGTFRRMIGPSVASTGTVRGQFALSPAERPYLQAFDARGCGN